MLLKLEVGDSRPLHEQVAGAIRRAVGEGECVPGERLPPARDLARALGVNANTVLRALRVLRDEGVLEFRRGRGITVVRGADRRAELLEAARGLVADAAHAGFSREELVEMIRGLE
ncbi:GntR family transcriptional regulator [Kitasatospora purpeofusca]|uniref:GntR family transcriptional regulator n=1 Tax=Kitasatospora purpeofusca TaxID=67352 RepID=A0ABZ1U8G3_9ACTN|nr:GntR family transcriptional regulator [Kitasatospora purpeofusca]